MDLKTFMSHCTPEARKFLEYVYKWEGAYVTEQVIVEIAHRAGVRAAEDLFTKPGMFYAVDGGFSNCHCKEGRPVKLTKYRCPAGRDIS
jgi:hypothetical protein